MLDPQEALIEKIKELPDFLDVTNSSFSPDEQTIKTQTPAICVIEGEGIYETGISSTFLIDDSYYEIHIVVQHETNDANHKKTEAIAGELRKKLLKKVMFYRPVGFNDVFIPVKRLRPQYFEKEGFAVFTVIVKIKTIS
jgi:hypothetical protein